MPYISPSRRLRAFVLLEVLVSLTILAIALSLVMRSFTTSLKAAKWSQHVSTASILARGLVESWQINRPPIGTSEGTFAPENPRYSYEVTYQPEKISYEKTPSLSIEEAVTPLRMVIVKIYVVSGRSERAERKEVLHFRSALIDSEIFDADARLLNGVAFE